MKSKIDTAHPLSFHPWDIGMLAGAALLAFAFLPSAHGQSVTYGSAQFNLSATAAGASPGSASSTNPNYSDSVGATYENDLTGNRNAYDNANAFVNASTNQTTLFQADVKTTGSFRYGTMSGGGTGGASSNSTYTFTVTTPTPYTLQGSIITNNTGNLTTTNYVELYDQTTNSDVFNQRTTALSYNQSFNQSDVLQPGTYQIFASSGTSFLASGATATQDEAFYTLSVVPEPGTWAGGALVLGAAGWGVRRRLRANVPARRGANP